VDDVYAVSEDDKRAQKHVAQEAGCVIADVDDQSRTQGWFPVMINVNTIGNVVKRSGLGESAACCKQVI
jgi:hypothetical protein